jgi:aspartate/methionine/tyrosine aminotransferase
MSSPASRVMQSPYMNFAKLKTTATYNLASSGVLNCTLADLGPLPDDLELHGPNSYGYAPVVERLAARFGVGTDCVVTALGTSGANHLAFSVLIAPGDEVLVEEPTYELMLSALQHLGARVTRFQRRPEAGWALEPDAVAAVLTPNTKLVVLSDFHNPTSTLADRASMTAVCEAAARVGATVLVDEVYRELLFGLQADGATVSPTSAFTLAPNVVVTSSLTKAYGVSGLRCGWILAQPDLAQQMWRLNDLFSSLPPHLTERLSVTALDRLPALKVRADTLIATNRAAYREFMGGHPALDQTIPDIGTTVFPRLKSGDVDAFATRLQTEYDTGVVPGRFFERADRFRVGLGGDPVTTREGLQRLAQALHDHAA